MDIEFDEANGLKPNVTTQYGVPLKEEKISVATTHNFKIVFDFTDENRVESNDFTILQPIIYYTLIT